MRLSCDNVFLLICLVCTNFYLSSSQNRNELDAVRAVGESLSSFGINLLQHLTQSFGPETNLATSPYTVWTLLAIAAEGAKGKTLKQLEQVLNIPASEERKGSFRASYRSLHKYLLQNTYGLRLEVSSGIFCTKNYALNRSYQSLVKDFYGVDVTPVDFLNTVESMNTINSYIAKATSNRITNFVDVGDLADAEILMASTFFFKGAWKVPFNQTETIETTFYDESGNAKGNVMMMHQLAPFPYAIVQELKAHAIELPYGEGDRMSMILILPRKGDSISSTLKTLAGISFGTVLKQLRESDELFGEEDLHVYLPRFHVHSDLTLNQVLDNMGIKDAFNMELADFLGIFPHYLYLSRVFQEAEIIVDEQGTTASAAAGATFANKSPPPSFVANRPFLYFIYDKLTSSVVFSGTVSNPNTIRV